MSTARRSRRGDDADDADLAQQREERKREREERKKQREAEAASSEADRQKSREERRKKRDADEEPAPAKSQPAEKKKEAKKEEAPAKVSVNVSADKTDSGAQTTFDKIDDDRKRRIIDSLIDRLYELAEERDNKDKPVVKAAPGAIDASALDLKVRSLRTRVRNSENASETLAKQQKDIEKKIENNKSEIVRLRKECAAAEAEYDEALKSGAIVPEAPKRGRGAGGGKGSGFFDVVKKAQSSLWEDKFRAFKEKQRGSSNEQPAWAMNLKKSDHILGASVKPKRDEKKKEEKAAWQNQPKVHKVVMDPRAKKDADPTGAKKPAWSGVSLKKAEKK